MFVLCSRAPEVSITAKPTDSNPHHPVADDAKASLRAELTTQLVAGQFALEAALAELSGADPTVRDRLRSQIGLIAGLRQQVGTASVSTLSALRAEVATIADSATTAAQDARASAAADASSAYSIATLARTAREQTNSVMAGMKDFDKDLKFGPGDSEADYRKREAERQSYIAAQQAKHTPEGDLNASGAAVGQMVDAKAHGAKGPEFDKRWDELTGTTTQLRESIRQSGGSTKEFDDHLRADVRQIMKAKGLTDAQIDARFAANPDPLAAAKAYVTEQDVGRIEAQRNVQAVPEMSPAATAVVAIPAASPPAGIATSAVDAMANLKAMGVVASEHDAGGDPSHGVTVKVATATQAVGSRT